MCDYLIQLKETQLPEGTIVEVSLVAKNDPSEQWGTIRLLLTTPGAYDFSTENLVKMEADIFACADDLEIFLSKYKLGRFIWIDGIEKTDKAPKGAVSKALKEVLSQYHDYSTTLLCYPCSYIAWSDSSAKKLASYYAAEFSMRYVENFCYKPK
jgi:hypothetical protein